MKSDKINITHDSNFKVLFENSDAIVGHIFETAYYYNKLTNEGFSILEFNNDPVCGVITKNNNWCIVGGDFLVFKNLTNQNLKIENKLAQIFDIKLIDQNKIQILTDPWGDNSEIWQLIFNSDSSVNHIELTKVKDFKEYIAKPYTENVIW